MRNKEVCKMCTNAFYKPGLGWSEVDDYQWNEHEMSWCPHCPTQDEYEKMRSNKIIPSWCLYKTEHLVLAENLDVK